MPYVDESDLTDWLTKKRTAKATQVSTPDPPPWATSDYSGGPPPGHVGLTPGWTPNYEQLILHDPAYLAWQNQGQLDISQAAAARKGALQTLIVRHGGTLSAFTDKYGDVDQATLDQAAANEFSDVSRLDRNYKQAVEDYKRNLSARGGLSSGELQYGLDQADYARATNEYDMNTSFLDAAAAAVNNYLGTEASVHRGEQAAISQAEQNVYSNPANRPTPGTEAQLDPDWKEKYGVPVYVGPNGELYTLDGNGNPVPYTPKPKPPAPPPATPPPQNPPPSPGQAPFNNQPITQPWTGGGVDLSRPWASPTGVVSGLPRYDPISKTWIG
jgi:hypothetical protein